MLIQTEEEFQMLVRAANRADRTHASEREQIERGISEDILGAARYRACASRAGRCDGAGIILAERRRRFFFDQQDQR